MNADLMFTFSMIGFFVIFIITTCTNIRLGHLVWALTGYNLIVIISWYFWAKGLGA